MWISGHFKLLVTIASRQSHEPMLWGQETITHMLIYTFALAQASSGCLAKPFNHYVALSTELEKNTIDRIVMTHSPRRSCLPQPN